MDRVGIVVEDLPAAAGFFVELGLEVQGQGPELIDRSYDAALATGYLWHEFGDSHLILP